MRLLVFLAFMCAGYGCQSLQAQEIENVAPPAETAIELSRNIQSGKISAESAVLKYLKRIKALDQNGPMIQSVIALNPQALQDARNLDEEAKRGTFRGPLHGVPVLIKDNIETMELPTTAGSLALAMNDTGRDAPIIAKLRAQGAIILGKTNLSEWANFRSAKSISGWSGIGGQTRNPHSLDRAPCGSSSGSAAAVAALFAPLAIGTETNGSITCPAAMNGVVGFKPTVGLVSRKYIIPISSSQDSAGPIARTVADAAMLLTIMAGSDPDDLATIDADKHRIDYSQALDDNITGMRVGVFRWAEGNNPNVSSAFSKVLEVLEKQGAVLIEISEFSPDPILWESGETLLRTEFRHGLNQYLSDSAADVQVRSLKDLIRFNEDHADRELALFDQSILIQAETSTSTDDPEHVEMARAIRLAAGENGIDLLLSENNVEVLIMPSAPPPSPIDIAFTTKGAGGALGAGWLAAMAGYPALTVPMGEHFGLPLGLLILGTKWNDSTVLKVGHSYQRATNHLLVPNFTNGPFDMPETASAMRPHVPRSSDEDR